MLKSMSVGNFRSIKTQVTIDLVKSPRIKGELANYVKRSHYDLANTSVIYGANASGKSNVLRSMSMLKAMVLNSARFEPNDQIGLYDPFRLSPAGATRPVHVELDFFLDEIRYIYTLGFDSKRVEYEQLYYYPEGVKARLFERKGDKKMAFGTYFKGEKKVIEKLTLPNQLFLSKAAENNAESVLPVYDFFKNRLHVYTALNEYNEAGLERLYARRLASAPDSAFAKKLNALICALDTGIRSVSAREADLNMVKFPDHMPEHAKARIQEEFKYEIRTLHGVYDDSRNHTGNVDFEIDDESNGTRSLLSLAGIIIDALEKGSILVIDEFEKNLHPLITTYLTKLFQQPEFNPRNAQLIVSTHDVTQLREDLYNRDQIWFTQKSEYGETELISCAEIKGLRADAPLDKWYLSGRLGGTAIINDQSLVSAFLDDNVE